MDPITLPIKLKDVYQELETSRACVPFNKRYLFENVVVDEQIREAKKKNPEIKAAWVKYYIFETDNDIGTDAKGHFSIEIKSKTVLVEV